MASESQPADPVRRRSRAPTSPTLRLDSPCTSARDSGQSSGASALDLFRVALPQPGFPRPWLARGTLGLLGSRAWREAASRRGRMPPRSPPGLPGTPTVEGWGGGGGVDALLLCDLAGGTGPSGGAGTDQPAIEPSEVADLMLAQ